MDLKKLLEYNTFVLLILLMVKVILYFIFGGMGGLAGDSRAPLMVGLSIIYLLTFVGTIKKIKWSSLLVVVTVFIDTIMFLEINSIMNLMVCAGEKYCIFILSINIFLLFLSVIEYNRLNKTNK